MPIDLQLTWHTCYPLRKSPKLCWDGKKVLTPKAGSWYKVVMDKWRLEIKRECQPYKEMVGQKLSRLWKWSLIYLCTMDDGVAPNEDCAVGPSNPGILPYGPFCSRVMIRARLPVLLSFHLPEHGNQENWTINLWMFPVQGRNLDRCLCGKMLRLQNSGTQK